MGSPADLDNDGRSDIIVAASDYPDQFGCVFHQKPDGDVRGDRRSNGASTTRA